MGIVQDESKAKLDRVSLDQDKSESLRFFGFTQNGGSYFELTLTVASLYPDRDKESRWRFGRVRLLLDLGDEKGGKFVYEHEQLLDYDAKRRHPDRHENLNVYKIGSLTIETVLAFSFTRILFNGLMRVGDDQQVRPVRLAISTHPTCDKFDYKYRFDTKYTAAIIERSLKTRASTVLERNAEQLLDLVLEDRFDQPLMFQGRLESLDDDNSSEMRRLDESFVMWGAKVKLFADARNPRHEKRDCLFAWTECGHQIHLSRPGGWPNLVYGMVHNSYDYASQLLEASLWEVKECVEKEVEFGELKSFDELKSSHVIKLKAFQVKDYKLEFGSTINSLWDGYRKPTRIKINSFNGWTTCQNVDLSDDFLYSEHKMLVMKLDDDKFTFKLARERLLGGKGQSLVELSRLAHAGGLSNIESGGRRIKVSVPKGLILTSKAGRMWLESDPRNIQAIKDLNETRTKLAAKSVYTNPLSADYLGIGEAQRQLREKCQATYETLVACQLPVKIWLALAHELTNLFDAQTVIDIEPDKAQSCKPLAVRSSAVGEDSLETSAAGQMRTILNVRGVEAMSKAIVECWASQFLLEAVTYKSQNGLDFYLPMAVVVQELVECQVAGVAATCNPMTGNRRQLEIVGNLGLGENVVAGRQADTVRISSDRLDNHAEKLSSWRPEDGEIEKLTATGKVEDCCLSDEQIEALANLLLEIRRTSELQDREVEWGITWPSGKSSEFQIHLLQSRPLTNLRRLTADEVGHELDWGLPCALDQVSRANLGEVMPGALCPMYASYFSPISTSSNKLKPFAKDQTRKPFTGEQFAYHAQMSIMLINYGEVIKRFMSIGSGSGDKESEQETTVRDVMNSMIGFTLEAPKDEVEREFRRRFVEEKFNPLMPNITRSFSTLMMLDLAIVPLSRWKLAFQRAPLHENLKPVRDWIELSEGSHESGSDNCLFKSNRPDMWLSVEQDIRALFGRLLTTITPISMAWTGHILATLTGMALNTFVLKLMCSQPAYAGSSMVASEILNDYSVLMREPASSSSQLGNSTESGDISKLLDCLLECFVAANQIDQLKQMEHADLYKSLCANQLFVDFMTRNGHRAWKEFCLSTKTWRDDPSYIVRLLAARLKSYSVEEARRERDRKQNADLQHEKRLAQVLAKLTSNKWLLLNYALPRARSATIRRESSKSMLIKTIDKYRQAFRHLAGLMCLVGLLPSAELIFFLTIEELAEIVRKCCAERPEARQPRESVMPRLLYKARRRQQHCRLFDRVTFPKPTLTVNEMFETIREQMQERGQDVLQSKTQNGSDPAKEVRGITSCAGCITGRACVISSIDEVDQLRENDILVTYSIDISWSVYFFMLSGIVTELGGIVSHGAVVAREYGLPTLCTAVGACSRFETGQIITLDANRGVCYIASESKAGESVANGTSN